MKLLHEWRNLTLALVTLLFVAAAHADWNHPPRGRTKGLEHHTFRSAANRTEVGYNVCVPPEYAQDPQRRFPVIYYLHGYDGHESSYLEYADYWRASLPRTGPCLLVFVNGGDKSFFSDAPNRSVMGEVVVLELVKAVDSKWRTIQSPAGRSLHGYSMGGFGALKLAFKFPDQFGSVVAFGPTLASADQMQEHLGKVYRQMFGSAQRFAENDPLQLATANADKIRGRVTVLTIIGTKDEFLPGSRQLQTALKSANIAHQYVELPGVKHSKDPLYERAGSQGFEFSGKAFKSAPAGSKP